MGYLALAQIIVSIRKYEHERKIVHNRECDKSAMIDGVKTLPRPAPNMANSPKKPKAQSGSAKERKSMPSTQAVVLDVRQRIASQALLPGSRLPEEDLVKNYGIPRAKAREVLATLEDRGLIERVPNKGAVVVPVDMETTYRLYQVRETLDSLSVRLAMENASATDYEALQQMLGPQFEETLRDGDIESHVDTIVRFRNRVNEIADNPVLSDLIERIYERMQVTMRRVALLPGRAEMGIKQYRTLLDAMIRNDVDEADRCVRELNQSAREYIRRYKDYL